MAKKDKRVKGCPNESCGTYKKIKYKANDNFCNKCGAELVFVCPKCFKALADLGPEHVYCESCQASKQDKIDAVVDAGKKIGGAAALALAAGFKGEAGKHLKKFGGAIAKKAFDIAKDAIKK